MSKLLRDNRYLLVIIALLLFVIVLQMPKSETQAQAWKKASIYERVMSNADTLSASDQTYVDSLAYRAAKIVLKVLNGYGSNSAGFTRKNWGALHLYDGDGGTDHSCGISERFTGDNSFGMHVITAGDHSSGIKIAGEGDHTNHRLLNLVMSPDATTSTSHTGLLIRNASELGIPIDIETGSDAEALKIVHRDTSSTPGAKGILTIQADSCVYSPAQPSDYVCMGLDISGTALEGVADRYIRMTDYDGSGNYWGFRINAADDEFLFYYNNTKVAGIATDGTYTDYVP